MKENGDAGRKTRRSSPGESSLDSPVSSRRLALESLRTAVSLEPAGPVLLTGEAGTGKTWLCRRLVQDLAAGWRSVSIEVSQALEPPDFLRLIGDGLGIDTGGRIGAARVAIAHALEDDLGEGRTWMLVLEDVHQASQPVWSEVHALVNALEAGRGFGAMILTGPTELARRLASRPGSAMASRISCHVHLLPFDLDEACELMGSRGRSGRTDRRIIDELHREASGNPRRLLRAWREGSGRAEATAAPGALPVPARPVGPPVGQEIGTFVQDFRPALSPASFADGSVQAMEPRDEPGLAIEPRGPEADVPLVPSRPPIRIEEGLIEVGWEGSLDAESAAPPDDEPGLDAGSPLDDGNLPSEEMVEDHYAALQAWTEWARNRGRGASLDLGGDRDSSAIEMPPESSDSTDPPLAEVLRPAGLRVESRHEHAPYSQLFSRLRQSS